MTDIIIPEDLWEEDIEGTLIAWLYADGAAVQQGEPVAELMVEKVQHELAAPATGKLVHVCEEEALIRKGQTVARIE